MKTIYDKLVIASSLILGIFQYATINYQDLFKKLNSMALIISICFGFFLWGIYFLLKKQSNQFRKESIISRFKILNSSANNVNYVWTTTPDVQPDYDLFFTIDEQKILLENKLIKAKASNK